MPFNLRSTRESLRLSQEALARELGMTVRTLARWEASGVPEGLQRMLELAIGALKLERRTSYAENGPQVPYPISAQNRARLLIGNFHMNFFRQPDPPHHWLTREEADALPAGARAWCTGKLGAWSLVERTDHPSMPWAAAINAPPAPWPPFVYW